jgi:two-component system chemotaxis response regulator CheB
LTKIRVIIVDDSAIVRKILNKALSDFEEIEIIATAKDAYEARDLIVELQPDVITLDIEMPKMNGLQFLSKIMKYFPIPVIMVSSFAKSQCDIAVKALEIGAVDVLPKPTNNNELLNLTKELAVKIKMAYTLKEKVKYFKPKKIDNEELKNVTLKNIPQKSIKNNLVIAIGASTGGTEAITQVIKRLPSNMPPIVMAQHMPPVFTTSFAERLNNLSQLNVKEAADGDVLKPGTALLAPGDFHMILKRNISGYYVNIKKGPKIYYQRPAVEVLFKSTAKLVGRNAIGVILTGMGRDGSTGLLEMFNAGAYTIGQDAKSSVVYGMPKAAFELGAVKIQLPLDKIADEIINYCSN